MKSPHIGLCVLVCALSILFTNCATAEIVLDHSYESNPIGSGVEPSEMASTYAEDLPSDSFGISNEFARTGDLHFYMNMNDGGTGTGGRVLSIYMHSVSELAQPLAYGTSVDASVYLASSSQNPLVGDLTAGVLVGFFDQSGGFLFGTDFDQTNSGNALTITNDYQLFSESYTLNANDVTDLGQIGFVATAVIADNEDTGGAGTIFADDFTFEVNPMMANPEPKSILMFGIAMSAVLRRRR